MDSLKDKEFNEIFERISMTIDLKGCRTPQDINRRIRRRIQKESYVAGPRILALLRATNQKSALERLIPGFGQRTIDEAYANPKGEVALTLKYGRRKAKDILANRERTRRSLNRKYRRKRR
jgi:hypothetical protein